ncbi:MAG TPA: hypothetical protein VKB88_00030 [Bryobacteraceae bacterium]|nr:hypothetical protein [Bryobacteraceae bacterium]
MSGMRDFILLFVHVIVTMARLAGPGGLRSVVAESARLRHQLLILNRGRQRAPNLWATDRITAGLFTLLISQARILRSATEALHLAVFTEPVEKTEVPHAIFASARASPRPEGTEPRTYRRRGGHEEA